MYFSFFIGNASLFGLTDYIPSLQSDDYWVVSIFVISYVSNTSERGNNSSEANLHELKRCNILLVH
jgi:hypothetical protein